jgi:hypothetical protein
MKFENVCTGLCHGLDVSLRPLQHECPGSIPDQSIVICVGQRGPGTGISQRNRLVPYKKTIHQYVQINSLINHQQNVILATNRFVKNALFFLLLSYSSEVSPHQYRKEHLIWALNHFNALQNCERRLSPSSCLSLGLSFRMEQLGSTGRIFITCEIWVFFENLSKKSVFFTIKQE